MKNEFNIRSGAATWRYLRAMAFMVPPLLTVGAIHGWQGLLIWGSFTAMAANWHLRQNPRVWDETLIRQELDKGHLQHFDRLQEMTDRVADRFHTPHLPIYRVSPESGIPHPPQNAQTDGHVILIAQHYELTLTDAEKEWVIAHELDHARHPTDMMAISTYTGARLSLGGIAAYTAWQMMDNLTWMASQAHHTVTIMSAFCLSFQCLAHAYHAQSQGNEFRADTNALQNTGNMVIAKRALQKATGLSPLLHDIFSDKSRTRQTAKHTHPDIEDRFANLRIVAAKMRAQQKAAAPAPDVTS